MLPSRWTPFALRWAFPTAIDYYEALRPRITPSDAAIPVLFSQDRLGGFSCSIDMSLPELRLHLYTEGPILTVIPLYHQATLILSMSCSHVVKEQADLNSRTIPNISSPVKGHDASTMVRLLALSRRD